MEIKYVTCSGTNETTSMLQLVNLLQVFPLAEIGVQVSAEQCLQKSGRLPWIYALSALAIQEKKKLNAALHVNNGWVADLGQGIIAPELMELMNLKGTDGEPFFQRIQLNFKVGREQTPDLMKLGNLLSNFPQHRFILSYNDSNKTVIEQLYERGREFDLLYDGSFGQGIAPDMRPAPVWPCVLQGYAGGIGPDNVSEVLSKVHTSWLKKPNYKGIYLDAQRRLEDEDGHLDLRKCAKYLQQVDAWRWRTKSLS